MLEPTHIMKLEHFLPKHLKIYKISVSCNWKTFTANTNTLNRKPRASTYTKQD